MAATNKIQSTPTPQFPALSYQTEQPNSRQWTTHLLVRCGTLPPPIESTTTLQWTYQIHSAHCKTPSHLKPIHLIPPLNPEITTYFI